LVATFGENEMRTVEELEQHIRVLIKYSEAKILQRDWHAVADAMMDIRELEAKIQVINEINNTKP
jgi:hypothetical protein